MAFNVIYISVISFCLVSGYVFAAGEENLDKYIVECNKTHPIQDKLFTANAENVSSLFRETFKDNHNAQCLMKCVMNKLQVVDESGNIIAVGLQNHLIAFEANMTEYLKNNTKFNLTAVDVKHIEEFISKCKIEDEKEEPCLKSYKLLLCLAKENDYLQPKLNETSTLPANATTVAVNITTTASP